VPAYLEEVERVLGAGAMDELERGVTAIETRSVPLARLLFARWLDHVVEPAR
jgi:hypothetical protein